MTPGSESAFSFPVAFGSTPRMLIVPVARGKFLLNHSPVVSEVGTTGFKVYCPSYMNLQSQVRLTWYAYEIFITAGGYWRQSLFQAVESCAYKNYRQAFIDADAAFDFFLEDYLEKRFSRLRMPRICEALRDRTQDLLQYVVSSPAISNFDYKKTHCKLLYDRWCKDHRLRNQIVHETKDVTEADTSPMILNILELITIIDKRALSKRFIRLLQKGNDGNRTKRKLTQG